MLQCSNKLCISLVLLSSAKTASKAVKGHFGQVVFAQKYYKVIAMKRHTGHIQHLSTRVYLFHSYILKEEEMKMCFLYIAWFPDHIKLKKTTVWLVPFNSYKIMMSAFKEQGRLKAWGFGGWEWKLFAHIIEDEVDKRLPVLEK